MLTIKLIQEYQIKEYEGKPTKVKRPIGSEFYIQIGRDKGQVEFGSNYALHLETEEILSKDFEWKNSGDSLEMRGVSPECWSAEPQSRGQFP